MNTNEWNRLRLSVILRRVESTRVHPSLTKLRGAYWGARHGEAKAQNPEPAPGRETQRSSAAEWSNPVARPLRRPRHRAHDGRDAGPCGAPDPRSAAPVGRAQV